METNEMNFILEALAKARGKTMPISSMNCQYSLAGHKGLLEVIHLLIESNKIEILNETHLRLIS